MPLNFTRGAKDIFRGALRVSRGGARVRWGFDFLPDTSGSLGGTGDVTLRPYSPRGESDCNLNLTGRNGGSALINGTVPQPLDAELSAIAGLTSAANKGIYFTGSGTAALFDLSTFARTVLDDPDALTMRATMGLIIGTNVQAYDAELAALAGLTSAADKLPYFTGSGTASLADLSAAARTVIDDPSVAAMVNTLGGASSTGTGGLVRQDTPTLDTPVLDQPDIADFSQATHNHQNAAGGGTLGVGAIGTVTTDRLIGRDTAGVGGAEEISVGGGVEFTGGPGIQRSALTGDVTASAGSNATTIANAAVTLAKMANLAQDQFIGRVTASTGVPETATITAAARTVLDDSSVSAMVDTLGGAASSGTGGLARITSPAFVTPALGTPASGVLTNCTGTAAGLTAGNVTTNANLTGAVTSVGNATSIGSIPGRLVSFQTFTAAGSGTYTRPAGVTSILVELLGAGGGGGGAAQTASNAAAGGGGASGGYCRKWFASAASTYSYAVGALGAGGTAGANDGTGGGSSTFSTMTANGGTAGKGCAASTVPLIVAGGSTSVSSGGDINGGGTAGGSGMVLNGTIAVSGAGGSSEFGGGGTPALTERAGIAGMGYGSGGSGGLCLGTTARAGGAGKDGLIIVWEFS